MKNLKMFEEFTNESKNWVKSRQAAHDIFKDADQVDNWSIDYDPEHGESEANGGKEFLVYVKDQDKFYLVQTTNDEKAMTSHEVIEKDLDKDDHILVSIKKYRAENK